MLQEGWRRIQVQAEVRKVYSEKAKRRREEEPERHRTYCRKSALKNKYGITLGDYDAMLREQNRAVCNMLFASAVRGTAVYRPLP